MAKFRGRNKLGQFDKNTSILITKALQNIADEVAIRVKPVVRDELERTYRYHVYTSYTPATKEGANIKKYNETHTHQKKQLYHHTGIFASSIKGLIEGSTVKIVIEPKSYPDGQSTTEVYEYLTKGTRKKSNKTGYYYDGGEEFSTYISTPKHNFEQRTLDEIEIYLNNLADDLKNHPENYSEKYRNKRL